MTKSKEIRKPLALKRKWASLFIWTVMVYGRFLIAIRALQIKLYAWNIYQSLYEISLEKYISLCVSNDTSYLKRKSRKFVPRWLLDEANAKLRAQYYEILDTPDIKAQKTKANKINTLVEKMYKYNLVLETLVAYEQLESMGKVVDDETPMAFCKKLRIKPFTRQRCILVLESNIISFKSEYEKIIDAEKPQREEEEKPLTRESFSDWVITLNHNNFPITYDMSAGHYVRSISNYLNYCEEMKKQTKKNDYGRI